MKTWLVKLTVDVVAHIEMPNDWPEDAVGMMALEAISFFPPGNNAVTLEIENAAVDDIVELHEDKG